MNRLAESLLWASRRAIVDPLILELMIAWEECFRRQGRYFIRKGVPKLQEGTFFEAAARQPDMRALDAIAAAVNTLDDFRDTFAGQTFTRVVSLALVGGAQQTQRDTGSFILGFDLKSPVVLDYLKQHSAEKLGADVDATTKTRLRSLLTKGYKESWGIGRTKVEIRNLFDGFAAKATQAHIETRAELIAVTEIGQAFSHGALEQGKRMEDQGIKMEKAWALAANACAICAPNASQGWILIERQFFSGHDRPLAHPACRCSLLLRAKPVA